MVSTDTRTRKPASAARRPTEYLFQSDADQLSPVMIYRLTVKGFDVKDVLAISTVFDEEDHETHCGQAH